MTIDQELQQALDVDPSPEFLARVRTRIASEPAPRRLWGFSWMFAAAAAAAAILIAVVVMRSTGPNKTGSELLASRSLGAIVVPTPVPAAPNPVARPFHPSTTARDALSSVEGQGRDRAAALQPDLELTEEIVIDQREAAALRRLLNIGTINAEEGFALIRADEIQIEPIVIAPLEESGEGVRQ